MLGKGTNVKDEFIVKTVNLLRVYEERNKVKNSFDEMKYGKEKIDKIINFLINHFSTEELLDVFSYKSYAMLMKLDYSLEDNFLEIKTENISLVKKSLKNYQRIKDDRNNINHANRKNLSSVEELGKFIKDSIKQIKNI